jgi:cell fate (sporulation/competence/biofilm development) regulator YlbF (YheA/YmcA/DUF963 family)
MAADLKAILDAADKLGQMLREHTAVERYRQAQQTLSADPDAQRSLAEFDRHLESLARQEQSGMGVTDAQRQQLEALQARIVSNIKVKALNMAQVEFIDLLRRVNQTVLRHVQDAAPAGGAAPGGPGGPGPSGPGGPRVTVARPN